MNQKEAEAKKLQYEKYIGQTYILKGDFTNTIHTIDAVIVRCVLGENCSVFFSLHNNQPTPFHENVDTFFERFTRA